MCVFERFRGPKLLTAGAPGVCVTVSIMAADYRDRTQFRIMQSFRAL